MASVLLYNLENKEKLTKVKFILFKLGLTAREVSPAEFGQSIGFLAGLEGFEAAAEADLTENFSEEMLVMCGLSSMQFSAFLNGLRQNHVPVALKAVLTETNAQWSSNRLHRELAAEHAAMQKVHPKDAAKKSTHKK